MTVAAEFHVVLSFGDIYRQSGYRTKVLGELRAFETGGSYQPFLIAFDRDSAHFDKVNLGGIPYAAHPRWALLHYYRDLAALSKRGRIRIVHAHNLYSSAIALSARWFFGYKVIADLHGRVPEEYFFLGKGGKISRWLLTQLEKWVVRRADHAICVSEKLRSYIQTRHHIRQSKLTLLPCCTDGEIFKWTPAARESARKKLGFGDKFVCVHLGSVRHWYDPDLIIQVFEKICQHVASAHLLVATGDVEHTQKYFKDRILANRLTVLEAPHNEVPALLAASDLGLLLLQSSPNIETSSPTKFAEYLNCGLPVLITPSVGDFSGIVAANNLGAVVSEDGRFDIAIVDRILAARQEIAEGCMKAGRTLTWEAWRSAWTAMMDSLN
jgi:glycosyltransferase involved in cell wall biosynthesis